EACAERSVDVLFVVGADPLRDHPDATLVRRALANVGTLVVQSLELGDLEPFASAFLPASAAIERDGHLTDWEGRWQRIRPVRGALGISRPDWEIFCGLAVAMGADLGFETLDEIRAEMASLLMPRSVGERPNVWAGAGAPQWIDDLTLFTYPMLVDEG